MKSIFDASTQEEVLKRVETLSPDSKALWGKMNVYQMLKHCSYCDDMYLGAIKPKRAFIGRILGPIILKQVLKEGKDFGKNSPTSPELVSIQDSGNLDEIKAAYKDKLASYLHYNNPNFIHPFFGPVTKEQVGYLAYKHIDHHLRQFGS